MTPTTRAPAWEGRMSRFYNARGVMMDAVASLTDTEVATLAGELLLCTEQEASSIAAFLGTMDTMQQASFFLGLACADDAGLANALRQWARRGRA